MAYSTPTVEPEGPGGYIVTIAGTALAAGTEVAITGLPKAGRVRRVKAHRTSGTGTTLNPILGTSTDPSGTGIVWENDEAAADVDWQPEGGALYYSPTGTLYWRGRCDGVGADNVEAAELLIEAGWGK